MRRTVCEGCLAATSDGRRPSSPVVPAPAASILNPQPSLLDEALSQPLPNNACPRAVRQAFLARHVRNTWTQESSRPMSRGRTPTYVWQHSARLRRLHQTMTGSNGRTKWRREPCVVQLQCAAMWDVQLDIRYLDDETIFAGPHSEPGIPGIPPGGLSATPFQRTSAFRIPSSPPGASDTQGSRLQALASLTLPVPRVFCCNLAPYPPAFCKAQLRRAITVALQLVRDASGANLSSEAQSPQRSPVLGRSGCFFLACCCSDPCNRRGCRPISFAPGSQHSSKFAGTVCRVPLLLRVCYVKPELHVKKHGAIALLLASVSCHLATAILLLVFCCIRFSVDSCSWKSPSLSVSEPKTQSCCS